MRIEEKFFLSYIDILLLIEKYLYKLAKEKKRDD